MVEKTSDFQKQVAAKRENEHAKAVENKVDMNETEEVQFETNEEVKDQEEDKKIHYTVLGGEECPVQEDDEELDYCMQYRIPKIEGLEKAKNLRALFLRKNLIKRLEGLEENIMLEEIELYDNRIRHIDNINHLTRLTFLDLSFNRIKEIRHIDNLVNLQKLYLSANRLKKMENLNTLVNLKCLDLGDNRIRKIENIDKLVNLSELHLAKNKLTVLENLDTLQNLTLIACQVNFIQKIEGLDKLENLEELYMQQNQVAKIDNLDKNLKLNTLDLAMNKLTRLDGIEHLSSNGSKTLTQLWLNWNFLEDCTENVEYLSKLGTLECIYLADNPMTLGDNYQQMMISAIPNIKQIDGNHLRLGRPFYHQKTAGIHSIVKKQIPETAAEMIESVLASVSVSTEENKTQ